MKIAIIDTGVGSHPDLPNVVDGQNFTTDQGNTAYKDIDGHGTHVAGIIGAQGQLSGIAPGVHIYVGRVFRRGEEADNDDIAEAIRVAVDVWNCDIINLSLGGPYDPLIENRINYATQRGALCVAAAGNSGGPVEFPAALQSSFCVAALGQLGTYPQNTLHVEAEPKSRGLYGLHPFYAATFIGRGREVDACAPGVAIISTVPPAHYTALDGTSMSCPMASGAAAILLSRDHHLFSYARNARRTSILKAQLQAALEDVRLPMEFQGGGRIRW